MTIHFAGLIDEGINKHHTIMKHDLEKSLALHRQKTISYIAVEERVKRVRIESISWPTSVVDVMHYDMLFKCSWYLWLAMLHSQMDVIYTLLKSEKL